MKPRTQIAAFAILALLALAPATPAAEAATLEAVRAALPELEAYADKLVEDDEVPGLAVAVVFGDEVVYVKGFGVRVEGGPKPVDADTVFQIASLSKSISSTVVAALVSKGAVSWNSRVADIDPAFRLHEPYATEYVTVADLFAHHSGLPGNAGNELESLGYDRDEILHRLRLVKPLNSFRGGYSYSNFGLTAGAVAAAKAAGLNWEDAAEKVLFGPLDMRSTSARHANFLARENRAELHVRLDGKWQPISKRDPDAQAPAGGVSSSARDLAQWLRLELGNGVYDGNQLIAEDAIAQTHVPVTAHGIHPITGLPSFYALGWNISYGRHGVVWGHAGAFSNGARSVTKIYPEENLGIVVLANAFPTGVPEAVADTFTQLVLEGAASGDRLNKWNGLYESMFGPAVAAAKKTYGAPPDPQSPSLAASAYVGTYSNAYIGQAIVAEEGGTLLIKLGPGGGKSLPLDHFDRDLFIYYPYDEMPDTPYSVTFQIGSNGKATSITIEDLNDLGLGLLPRNPN